ncbi:MAG: DNA polymerase III subunit chi [Gammaproteobacteria bacterium]|nr:DNA polymerase III subunit chi [Gammaproteobacteria bacterium]
MAATGPDPGPPDASLAGPGRVDFYIVTAADDAARLRFACRLAEKAYHLGHRVHLQAASPAEAGRLDELLWTFRQGSFVPHEIATGAAVTESPVTIGHGEGTCSGVDLLINLVDGPPASDCTRLAEVIAADDMPAREHGRERYRHYRGLGCELATHEIEAAR